MKRRLTIARSLVSEPELLILDEPTTGLDPQARHLLWDRLYRLKQEGVTLVITTHYMDEAEQLCDRLVVMDRGRFAAEGTPASSSTRYSTREVVELRFRPGEHERLAARLDGRGRPGRGAARPPPPLHRRRRRHPGRGPPRGPRPRERPGAPLHPGGRLPAPDRPDPGRLTLADRWPRSRRPATTARRRRRRRRRGRPRPVVRGPCATGRTSTSGPGAARSPPASSTRPLPGGHGRGPRLAGRPPRPPGRRRAPTSTSSPPASWPPPPCRSGPTRRCTRSWGPSSGSGPTSPCWPPRCGSIDVLIGHLAWIAIRLLIGRRPSTWRSWPPSASSTRPCALLALPAGGRSPAWPSPPPSPPSPPPRTTTSAFTALYRFGLIPLFLFSGTFFPVTQLPGWLQPVAYATPLYHGVALCRGLVLGTPRPGPALGDAAYLVALTAVGYLVARLTFAGGWSCELPTPGSTSDGGRRRRPCRAAPAASLPCASPRRPCSAAAGPAGSSSATSSSTGGGWIFFVSGFFEPFFYLLSIGVGLNTPGRPAPRRRPRSSPTPPSWPPGCWPRRP